MNLHLKDKVVILTCIILFVVLSPVGAKVKDDVDNIETKVIAWRRDIHQHPELSNREFRTSKLVEQHLNHLGMEVKTGIAHTGVVGILKGGLPGPTIALRADMDALPVTEEVNLPFASKQTATYQGKEVGVMHACGHDTHVAILMGAAEVLAKNKDKLKGTVIFIFQPAEEGAPGDEQGGAGLMLAENLFKDTKPDVIFGLHVISSLQSGIVGYHSGPAMAAVDTFYLTVKGKQTHGALPWRGVDPIVASAQIINAVQSIVARKVDVTKAPVVISFGTIESGTRHNIIPDKVEMTGTIRNFDMEIRDSIHQHLKDVVKNTAKATGATAELTIEPGYPVTVNNPKLTEKMLPSLRKVFGNKNVIDMGVVMGADDFSYFAQQVPGFYFFIGVTPAGVDPKTAPANHSQLFFVDESNLIKGVKAFVQFIEDYTA